MEDIVLKYGLAGVVIIVLFTVCVYLYKDYKKQSQKKEDDFKISLANLIEENKKNLEKLVVTNKDNLKEIVLENKQNIDKIAEIAIAKDRIHRDERAELREVNNEQFKRLNEVTDAGHDVMNANTNILSALKSLIENFKK